MTKREANKMASNQILAYGSLEDAIQANNILAQRMVPGTPAYGDVVQVLQVLRSKRAAK